MAEIQEKAKFKCKFCGMTFVSKDEYEKHLKGHDKIVK